MNCLQNLLIRSPAPHLRSFKGECARRMSPLSVGSLGVVNTTDLHRSVSVKGVSGSKSSIEMSDSGVEEEEVKSDVYSNTMTEAMGAVLTYRHELGMNYNFILPDLIVGSCLQTPADVDKLRKIGVKSIFCLQQNPDLEDFDAFDLRVRLPAVVSKLHRAINRNGGVTYIHCTAGMGRAPAVALAYMYWVLGYKLNEAHNFLLSQRSCFPKLDAIKSVTADILTGLKKKHVTLRWDGQGCTSVEISGLDIGWGQRIPLTYDSKQGSWNLSRDLLEGHYEYKYIIDGEWVCNENALVTSPNKDGHVNNYIDVSNNDRMSSSCALRARLTSDDPHLTKDEHLTIRQFLESHTDEE